ncbi:hypothetical protein TNCV_3615731 [Trichonephila clavipes]|nr:hypothetical protein TNCV_3615731 [Trichonephila clavipes]
MFLFVFRWCICREVSFKVHHNKECAAYKNASDADVENSCSVTNKAVDSAASPEGPLNPRDGNVYVFTMMASEFQQALCPSRGRFRRS